MAPERPGRTMRRPPKGQKRPSYRKGEGLRRTDTIHGIGNDAAAAAVVVALDADDPSFII